MNHFYRKYRPLLWLQGILLLFSLLIVANNILFEGTRRYVLFNSLPMGSFFVPYLEGGVYLIGFIFGFYFIKKQKQQHPSLRTSVCIWLIGTLVFFCIPYIGAILQPARFLLFTLAPPVFGSSALFFWGGKIAQRQTKPAQHSLAAYRSLFFWQGLMLGISLYLFKQKALPYVWYLHASSLQRNYATLWILPAAALLGIFLCKRKKPSLLSVCGLTGIWFGFSLLSLWIPLIGETPILPDDQQAIFWIPLIASTLVFFCSLLLARLSPASSAKTRSWGRPYLAIWTFQGISLVFFVTYALLRILTDGESTNSFYFLSCLYCPLYLLVGEHVAASVIGSSMTKKRNYTWGQITQATFLWSMSTTALSLLELMGINSAKGESLTSTVLLLILVQLLSTALFFWGTVRGHRLYLQKHPEEKAEPEVAWGRFRLSYVFQALFLALWLIWSYVSTTFLFKQYTPYSVYPLPFPRTSLPYDRLDMLPFLFHFPYGLAVLYGIGAILCFVLFNYKKVSTRFLYVTAFILLLLSEILLSIPLLRQALFYIQQRTEFILPFLLLYGLLGLSALTFFIALPRRLKKD
ncbi:MAG TPA: hypothetical protein DEP42_02295 [Ruminococcaceae bacterium]|nr:hypothetical protein [Oscillospiraceae bacterium]